MAKTLVGVQSQICSALNYSQMRMTVEERHSLSSQVVNKSSQVIYGDIDTPKDCYEKNAITFCYFFLKKKKTSLRYDFLKIL